MRGERRAEWAGRPKKKGDSHAHFMLEAVEEHAELYGCAGPISSLTHDEQAFVVSSPNADQAVLHR